MNLKKFVIFILVTLTICVTILSFRLFTPQKTDAYITIAPVMIHRACTSYADSCPGEIRDLCYYDCVDHWVN